MVINQSVIEHRNCLPDVHQLEDPSLLTVYDQVLGMLTGPQTIRLRRNPGLLVCLHLRRAQRAFAKALYHQKKFAALIR